MAEQARFLERLFIMLQSADPRIVSWNEDGVAFQIHDAQLFMHQILPYYFNHANFGFFQHLLYAFGFLQPVFLRYQHPQYRRDTHPPFRHPPFHSKPILRVDTREIEGFGPQQVPSISPKRQGQKITLPPISVLLRRKQHHPLARPSRSVTMPNFSSNVPLSQVPAFLISLYDMLQNSSQDIISWSQKGKAFEIRNASRLTSELLPKYYRHNKFSSFQRQLNMYGFRKWPKAQAQTRTYSHDFFIRGHQDRLIFIKRGQPSSSSSR